MYIKNYGDFNISQTFIPIPANFQTKCGKDLNVFEM